MTRITRCLRCQKRLSADESILCYDCEEGGIYEC